MQANGQWGRGLVVGGAGFVGSNLYRRLLAEDASVDFRSGSIADDRVLAGLPSDFDHVFHLATYDGSQSSMADHTACHESNTLTTLKLWERLKNVKDLSSVVYATAGYMVAEKTLDEAEATTEEAPVTLWYDRPYQISKIIGELYGNYYRIRFGIPFVKAHFQNFYGPGEILGAGRWRGTRATVWRNVTPTFTYMALQGEALLVENGGVATQDFIHVDNVASLMACAHQGAPSGVYNLASDVETSILDFANFVNEVIGNTMPTDYKPPWDWDRPGKGYGSTEKAEDELGIRARRELREGLEQTIAWTRENMPLIARCIEQHRSLTHAT